MLRERRDIEDSTWRAFKTHKLDAADHGPNSWSRFKQQVRQTINTRLPASAHKNRFFQLRDHGPPRRNSPAWEEQTPRERENWEFGNGVALKRNMVGRWLVAAVKGAPFNKVSQEAIKGIFTAHKPFLIISDLRYKVRKNLERNAHESGTTKASPPRKLPRKPTKSRKLPSASSLERSKSRSPTTSSPPAPPPPPPPPPSLLG